MTDLTHRMQISDLLRETPIIAVLRADDATQYDRVVEVLIDHGVHSIELTLSTPGTMLHLPTLISRYGAAAEFGIGTITSQEEAMGAIDGGAKYLVTPVMDLDIVALAVHWDMPVFPGGLTPTELHSGWAAGATAVKIFPAGTVGPSYGRRLRGPFTEMQFVPSGGVELTDVQDWLFAGAAAVSLGSPLIGDALRGGSLTELAGRIDRTIELVAEARR